MTGLYIKIRHNTILVRKEAYYSINVKKFEKSIHITLITL